MTIFHINCDKLTIYDIMIQTLRPRCRRQGKAKSLVSAGERLGLVGGWMTLPAAKLSTTPPGAYSCARRRTSLPRMCMMNPSASSLQFLAGAVRGEWEVAEKEAQAKIREREAFPAFRAPRKSGSFDLARKILSQRFAPPARDNAPSKSLLFAA